MKDLQVVVNAGQKQINCQDLAQAVREFTTHVMTDNQVVDLYAGNELKLRFVVQGGFPVFYEYGKPGAGCIEHLVNR